MQQIIFLVKIMSNLNHYEKPLNLASYSFNFSESFSQFIHLELLLDFYRKSMNFHTRCRDSKLTFSHVVCITKEGEERGKREKRKSYCFIRFPPKKIMCLWEDSQKGVLSPFSSESIVHTPFNLNKSFHHIINVFLCISALPI